MLHTLHKNFFFLILFLFYNSSFAQSINWDSVRKAYFDKYQPTDTPAWLFPLIFEEGTGQRDTVYLSFDSHATTIQMIPPDTFDVKFGEKLLKRDTNVFNIYFSGFYPSNDSILKSFITNDVFDLKVTLEATKGYLPLKIYWDVNLFRSDSVPFPNQDPAPRAQGNISYDGWSLYPDNSYMKCFIDYPILLTDTGVFSCIKKDSLIFYFTMDTTQNIPIPYFYFSIEPWIGDWVGLPENTNDNLKIKIIPNPSSGIFTIKTTAMNFDELTVIDIFGRKVFSTDFSSYSSYNLNLTMLPHGIYVISINVGGILQERTKIIII